MIKIFGGIVIGVGLGLYLGIKLFESIMNEDDCDGLYR